MHNFDISIIGGGLIGSLTAISLAQANFKVAIFEQHASATSVDLTATSLRVYAINLAAQQFLQSSNIWSHIPVHKITPFTNMHLVDAGGPQTLTLDSLTIQQAQLGYIVEGEALQAALDQELQHYVHKQRIYHYPHTTISELQLERHLQHATVAVPNNAASYTSKLIIAADGANSFVCQHLGMSKLKYDYQELGIVAYLRTSKPHRNTAWQKFFATGPLALLPLHDPHLVSVVWTIPNTDPLRLLTATDAEFLTQIATAINGAYGEILSCSQRLSFPLTQQSLAAYSRPRLAVVGDAAHVIHPLAGQGLNLGIRDVAYLVQNCINARAKHRDIGGADTLQYYARHAKARNTVMQYIVQQLHTLFTNDYKVTAMARNLGIAWLEQVPLLQRQMLQFAVGSNFSNNK